MAKPKHIFIFGPDNGSFLSAKQLLSQLCISESCLIIDSTKTNFVSALVNKIGPTTQISLLFHGMPCSARSDTHCLDTGSAEIPTHTVLTAMQGLAFPVPLKVHLFSCYADLAHENLVHIFLQEGSSLTTYAPKDNVAFIDAFHRLWPSFFQDPGASMLQLFMHNLLPITALSGSLSVVGKHQAYVFQPKMDPVLAITAPQEGAVRLQQQFMDFYAKLPVKMGLLPLTSPILTETDMLHYQGIALAMAPIHGNMEFLNQFVLHVPERFKVVMTQESVGMLALFTAIIAGGEAVPFLLEHGIEPNNARIFDGVTPLMIAVNEGQLCNIRHLLEYGAVPDMAIATGETPLFVAAELGQIEIVRLLLEHRANPNAASDSNATPIMMATKKGHLQIVQLLLEYGADPNQSRKENGATPLTTAVYHALKEILKVLLEHGANANQAEVNRNTPLCLAVAYEEEAMLLPLLQHGANPHHLCEDGHTPFSKTFKQPGFEAFLELFLTQGVNPNHLLNKAGETALMIAISRSYSPLSAVKILLDYGANPNLAEESHSLTPIFMTLMQHHPDTNIMKALIKAGNNMLHECCLEDVCYTVRELAEGLDKGVGVIEILEQAEAQQLLLESIFPGVAASTQWVAERYIAAHAHAYRGVACKEEELTVYSFMDSGPMPMVVCDDFVS
jgi:ankyrin repeat protein